MKIIKKKYINLFNIKILLKINKNYIKNIKLVSEKFNNFKFFILVNHAFTGSHHINGIYKKNLKRKGWFINILKNFNKINFLCINNINSNFGSTNEDCRNILSYYNFEENFIKFKLKYSIKLKKIIIKKIKLYTLLAILGGSFGGVETILWNLLYPNQSKFYFIIASNIILDLKNLLLNKLNKLICIYFKLKNNYFNLKIKNIKNLKLSRILNFYTYFSKKDLIIKNNFSNYNYSLNYNKNYVIKNINNYINFNSNIYVKNFNIKTVIYYLNLIKIINLKKKINYKFITIISFNKDNRFIINYIYKFIKFFLKKNFINLYNIFSLEGHDSFLKSNTIYINIIKLYLELIGAIGFEPMTI